MKKLLLIAFLLCASRAFGATSASITTCGSAAICNGVNLQTGIRWDNVTSGLYSYASNVITVSGSSCTGGAPCVWTITDQNGVTITSVSATGAKSIGWPSTASTAPDPTAIFGQIDCTGSAANTVCNYNAPGEWPSGESFTITINGGALGNATITGTMIGDVVQTDNMDDNLQEWWKHRARILGFQSKPVTELNGQNRYYIGTYQPETLIFSSSRGAAANVEEQLVEFDNDPVGTQFPITAGSDINRPSWTYDGKYFTWGSSRCQSGLGCSTGSHLAFAQLTSGASPSTLATCNSGGYTFLGQSNSVYMVAYNLPDYVVTSDGAALYVGSLDNRTGSGSCSGNNNAVTTSIASYTGTSTQINQFSYPVGNIHAFRTNNTSCGPPILNSCSVTTYFYDLTGCVGSVSTNCATLGSSWNSYFGPAPSATDVSSGHYGYDANVVPHCDDTATGDTGTNGDKNCEYHFHDIWLARGSTRAYWLYGPFGTTGEPLFISADATGSNLRFEAPNFDNNVPYWSHPAIDWSGNLIQYGGTQACTPSGNTCTNGTSGEGTWDQRKHSAILFDSGVSVGHTAYDGFDQNRYAYDAFCSPPTSDSCLYIAKANWNTGTTTRAQIFDFGTRDRDVSGNTAFGVLYGPVQSPDATKHAEVDRTSFSVANRGEGWIIRNGFPLPPVRVRLTVTNAATVGWIAHPLNHETQQYHLYKQASCSGSWSRIADINAVYLQTSEYTSTDSALGSGSNACYALTSSEWDGIEGNTMSNVIKITNTAGTFSSTNIVGAGTIGFDTTAPANATGFAATLYRIPAPVFNYNLTPQTGGSLTAGTYWFKYVYCNYSDWPHDTLPVCTPPTNSGSQAISGAQNSVNLQNSNTDGQGQIAYQVYACGPSVSECTETLQTCRSAASSTVPYGIPSNGTQVGNFSCSIDSVAGSGAFPSSNTTAEGYTLSWTKSTDDGGGANDVRYYAIYSRDTAAPIMSQGTYNAQQWLIATQPAGTTSYLDYTANWYRIYNSSGGPFYAIVTVDRFGNRSGATCYNAATSSTVSCN